MLFLETFSRNFSLSTQLLHQDIIQKEPVYERILQNGENLLEASEPGDERDALSKRLDDVKNEWNDVKESSNKRKNDIDRLFPLTKNYNGKYVTFSIYLRDAEKQKENLEPLSTDKDKALLQQKETEVKELFILNFGFPYR